MKFDPIGDGISCIELLNCMGGDLDVVNDARASYDKYSTEWSEKDTKLIKYLMKHEHWSPFRGVVFKFRVTAPLYICRQWWKHVIASNHNDEQLGWNEQSLRYTTMDSAKFYIPEQFYAQAKSNKQCSGEALPPEDNRIAKMRYEVACHNSLANYNDLIDMGVSREIARGVLVPAVYVTWVWTVSLQALLNFVHLRSGKGAQSEITAYSTALEAVLAAKVPHTYKYFNLYVQGVDDQGNVS